MGRKRSSSTTPGVFSGAPRVPAVMSKGFDETDTGATRAAAAELARLRESVRRLEAERVGMRRDLGDALDAWESTANGEDLARVSAIRSRWALESESAAEDPKA